MDWTVLPARVAAKAWTDPVFLQLLLSNPTEQIRALAPKSCPAEMTFFVHANSGSVRHFPLPALQPMMATLPQKKLRQKVEEETGGTSGLDGYFLPASVIFRSFVDPEYRARLLADATATLRSDGFVNEDYCVEIHENSVGTHHLTLPVNAWQHEHLDYEVLVAKCVDHMRG